MHIVISVFDFKLKGLNVRKLLEKKTKKKCITKPRNWGLIDSEIGNVFVSGAQPQTSVWKCIDFPLGFALFTRLLCLISARNG